MVGLAGIAQILGCSRQNIRKLVVGNKSVFPSPVHDGNSAIWHLAKVLPWFKVKGNYKIEDNLIEVSCANMQVNIARQMQDMEPAFHRNIKPLLA